MKDPQALGFTLLHIGINHQTEAEGRATAQLLCELFGFPTRETPAALFVNEQFEVMKKPGQGALGHVAIGTTDVEGAMEYLKSRGVGFREDTILRDDRGGIRIVYLDRDIAGFAFHLSKLS